MNKKERRLALCCMLSAKVADKNLIVLDTLSFPEIKTKNMVEVVGNLKYTKNILLALADRNEVVEKSARNIPNVKTLTTDYLNMHDLLKYTTLVVLKDGVEKLNALR